MGDALLDQVYDGDNVDIREGDPMRGEEGSKKPRKVPISSQKGDSSKTTGSSSTSSSTSSSKGKSKGKGKKNQAGNGSGSDTRAVSSTLETSKTSIGSVNPKKTKETNEEDIEIRER